MPVTIRRRKLIAAIGGAMVAWPFATRAQQPERMRRIDVLMDTPRATWKDRPPVSRVKRPRTLSPNGRKTGIRSGRSVERFTGRLGTRAWCARHKKEG
jgi:hypothetical protein